MCLDVLAAGSGLLSLMTPLFPAHSELYALRKNKFHHVHCLRQPQAVYVCVPAAAWWAELVLVARCCHLLCADCEGYDENFPRMIDADSKLLLLQFNSCNQARQPDPSLFSRIVHLMCVRV
ncbi:hypothetical protein COO60DRAFT_1477771 [Scenedesmus sp. NREL 46B-D3]|nr:hypothetical protein COO60DRAFT_1477771 [Scenedesmus sp. NREL 46B-D3]